ncbi:MAG: phosphotransferase family protein [Alphaproteobacteria bacterium]|jgi:aminoglycoside phosphotransferase (APT) family kinase protein|nr:phosphotransferase family protein [Alphaproteobacteria bacterium]
MTGMADFDIAVLADRLRPRLPGDWNNLTVDRFVGGQSNPTYRLGAGGRSYVLRKQPPGRLLPSAHAIDREFRVMQALHAAGYPVPQPLLYVAEPEIVGTPFYVMAHVAGRVFKDPALPGLAPAERGAIYQAMAEAEGRLHRIDPAAVGLDDFAKPGTGFYARQVARWTDQYRAVADGPVPAMESLIDWLPRNLPASEERRLFHGDFRLENLIFHPTEPRLLAVLDWELATLGDPLADLAYSAMAWHLPQRAFGGFTDRDITGSGVPGEGEYLAAYCAAAGRPAIGNWDFYVAFAMFRLAAILYGVLRRGLDGNAASPDAIERGRLGLVCAEAGWEAASRGAAS